MYQFRGERLFLIAEFDSVAPTVAIEERRWKRNGERGQRGRRMTGIEVLRQTDVGRCTVEERSGIAAYAQLGAVPICQAGGGRAALICTASASRAHCSTPQ